MSETPANNITVVQLWRSDHRGRCFLVEHHEHAASDYLWMTELPAELLAASDVSQAFSDLLHTAQHLRHPNLARVYLAPASHPNALLQEHTGTLKLSDFLQLLDQSGLQLPAPIALAIITEIAHGVAYLHGYTNERGAPLRLVHGDLTADRINLGLRGDIKIDEWISAAVHRLVQQPPAWVEASLEHRYSPEQLAGEPLDTRTDVYQLGLLAWGLFAGRPPRGRVIAPLAHIIDRFPDAISDLVAQALAPERDQRFATALGFADALHHSAQGWCAIASREELSNWFSRYAMQHAAANEGLAPAQQNAAEAEGDASKARKKRKHFSQPMPLLESSGTLGTTLASIAPKRQAPWPLVLVAILALGAAAGLALLKREHAPEAAPIQPTSSDVATPSGAANQAASLPLEPPSVQEPLPEPATRPVVVQAPAQAAKLTLVLPARCKVFVDGKRIKAAKGQLTLTLTAGIHTVRIVPASKKQKPLERALDLAPGSSTTLQAHIPKR